MHRNRRKKENSSTKSACILLIFLCCIALALFVANQSLSKVTILSKNDDGEVHPPAERETRSPIVKDAQLAALPQNVSGHSTTTSELVWGGQNRAPIDLIQRKQDKLRGRFRKKRQEAAKALSPEQHQINRPRQRDINRIDFGNPPVHPRIAKKNFSQLVRETDYSLNWSLVRLNNPAVTTGNLESMKFRMCKLALGAYTRDPASIPFFRDLIMASGCRSDENTMILSWTEAEEFLAKSRVLTPAGFIHHEARVGSTLIANILASNEKNLVYSEPGPLTAAAAHFCKNCTLEERVRLLRMVVGLMGVSDNRERLFFKLYPVAVLELQVYKAAFPETPYIYLYREPVEVMMSLLRSERPRHSNLMSQVANPPPPQQNNGTFLAPRQRRRGNVSPCLRHLNEVYERSLPGKSAATVTTEEYCAAFLQTICQAAAKEMKEDRLGLVVQYDKDLADTFITSILPKHFKVNLSPEQIAKAHEVSAKYSKSRVPREGSFKADENQKREKAWPALKQMAEKYLNDVHNSLVQIESVKNQELKIS